MSGLNDLTTSCPRCNEEFFLVDMGGKLCFDCRKEVCSVCNGYGKILAGGPWDETEWQKCSKCKGKVEAFIKRGG